MNTEEKLGKIFNALAEEINITQTMLDKAVTAYIALGDHIKTANENWDINVYPQGSFELGTVVKPLNDEEQYDVDLVVLVKQPEFSAEELRTNIRALLESHGRYEDKIQDKKPCIRIQYADSSQFHMDIASAKKNGQSMGTTIEIARYDGDYKYYYAPSNPKGYVEWFKKVMKYDKILLEKRAMFEKAETEIEKLNLTKFRTPLQKAIQILKRHRNIYFDNRNSEDGPSSIIITTLCGLSYEYSSPNTDKKENTYVTIRNMLTNFDRFIRFDEIKGWNMMNPSMTNENFLKKWNENFAIKDAFYDWIRQARIDILINPEKFIETDQTELRAGIYKSFGESVGREALLKYGEEIGALAKGGNLKFNISSASITTDNDDRSYRKHTYFGGCNE